MKGEQDVIAVPREGFLDTRARAILGLTAERFAALQGELVHGEWTLVRHREHIMLPGMRKLAELCESELKFAPEGERRVLIVGTAPTLLGPMLRGRECLPPGDRE